MSTVGDLMANIPGACWTMQVLIALIHSWNVKSGLSNALVGISFMSEIFFRWDGL